MPASGTPSPEETPGPAASPLQIGQIVAGKYRIERQIGRGGMGVVLAATHLQLERLVAIKVMRRDLVEDERTLNRLLSEARAAARIRSEHVARVLDVGTLDEGAPFIVMEYLEGENLADLLDREGALEVEAAIAFMLQACEALAEVHVAEMVHRDLKPGNLFIARAPDGSPTLKIVDFGISKYIGGSVRERAATTSPQVLGSPFYMAPEQMRAEGVDARSDIWALGAILFEALAARPPFVAETLPEVYAAVLGAPAQSLEQLRPGLPAGLDDVVQRCLEKDPAQRFCDVADLAEALAPFGRAEDLPRVERITRILTNPDAVRPRISVAPPTLPAPVEGQAAVGGTMRGGSPLEHAGVAPERASSAPRFSMSPPSVSPGSVSSGSASPFSASFDVGTGVRGGLSATGPGDVSMSPPRFGSRWAWVALAAALVAVAVAFVLRIEGSPQVQRPLAASAEAPPRAPALESDVRADSPARKVEVQTAARALRAEPGASRSTREEPSERSLAAIRAALNKKAVALKPRSLLRPNRRPEPRAKTEARQRESQPEEADDIELEAEPELELSRPAAPSPARVEAPASSTDPWDPRSFGDRR
jgi:serine/threonine protein kinase